MGLIHHFLLDKRGNIHYNRFKVDERADLQRPVHYMGIDGEEE